MNWFETLFGFSESVKKGLIKQQFELSSNHTQLTSFVNNKTFFIGKFSTSSLFALKTRAQAAATATSQKNPGKVEYQHLVIGDVLELHHQHPNALFQVASQFNCLEFPSPCTTPEDGITQYQQDHTQGPACALACAAGTLYRNYFAQSPEINNLDEFQSALENKTHHYFYVQNGYTFGDELEKLRTLLSSCKGDEKNRLREKIKIGIHTDVGVTFQSRFVPLPPTEEAAPITVTQTFCSALSCGYSDIDSSVWEPFARLVLEAAYEATLWVACLEGKTKVFLTFLGGGVFANEPAWIADAIVRAIKIVSTAGFSLQIYICHYHHLDKELQEKIDIGIQKN